MFIHMFAFRWKPGVTEEQKQNVIAEIRKLQGQIPGLLETSVGVNISSRGQGYELGGVMKFADKAVAGCLRATSGPSEAGELADATDRADRSGFRR